MAKEWNSPYLWAARRLAALQSTKCGRSNQKASADGEVEAEVALAVMNISRLPSQPVLAKTGPDQQTNPGDDRAGNKKDFAGFVHCVSA